MADVEIVCEWTGDGFTPVQAHRKTADAAFVVGQRYVVEAEEVSDAESNSRRHFFKVLRDDFWVNLPEKYGDRWATSEHFRKYLLIKTGFHTMTEMVAESAGQAERIAAIAEMLDEYCLTIVSDNVVKIYRAESMARGAMGKDRFQEAKWAVLDEAASLVGVDPPQRPRR